MNKEQQNLIRRKAYAFQRTWLNMTGERATPKILVYYRRGLRKRIEELNACRPCIAGERYFFDSMKKDRKNFPTRDDLDFCLSAFIRGYCTDPK